jgi:hypothetical protein
MAIIRIGTSGKQFKINELVSKPEIIASMGSSDNVPGVEKGVVTCAGSFAAAHGRP